jgi:hypothetical protein
MATKPTQLPEWATSVSADVTEPLLAKKQTGWVNSELPPAGWFNWWMELVYNWSAYLDDLANQVFTWTAQHTFNGAIGGNDAAAVPQLNRLRAKNLIKAWAYCTTNGAGAITLVDGFNIDAVSLIGAVAAVGISQDMANANYAVIATVDYRLTGNQRIFATPDPAGRTTTGAQLIFTDATGAAVNPSTTAIGFSVMILGVQ